MDDTWALPVTVTGPLNNSADARSPSPLLLTNRGDFLGDFKENPLMQNYHFVRFEPLIQSRKKRSECVGLSQEVALDQNK
jgi:hypothetical protein